MTREEIIVASRPRTETVDVPEWGGGPYTVRALTCVERVRFYDADEAEKLKQESPARLGVLLLIACLHGPDGNPVFGPDDATAVEQMDGGLVNRLCGVANRVNGIGTQARAAAEKKSPTPASGSGCDSPGSAASPTPTSSSPA